RPGQRGLAKQADMASPEECSDLVAYAVGRFPDLCVLVNNAGVQGPLGPLGEVPWDDWAATVAVNLLGTACMCHQIIPHLRERKYGKIINLSGGGATAARPRLSAYAASKAAVVRLTETLAEELKECHVDVNAIAPGALNTRMLG